MTHSFDTHKYIKELVAKGMEEPQAEIIISTIVKTRDFDLSTLATKEQLTKVENEILLIKKDIDFLRQEMKAEISTIKFDILKWIIPFLVGIVIAIFVK